MSELRRDVTTGEWAILAPERDARPREGGPPDRPSVPAEGSCPFCPGNESRTPGPVLVLPEEGGPWLVRVVPNKFPALSRGPSPATVGATGLFPRRDGIGAHEVVVETPRQDADLATLPEPQVRRVLEAYHRRTRSLRRDPDVRLVVVFRNRGPAAGTSLLHPHSQIVALPVVSEAIRRRHEFATRYFDATGDCVYCGLVRAELEDGARIVATSPHFVAFEPFASRVAYETWIAPRRHENAFPNATPEELDDLAAVLRDLLGRLSRILGDPDYNYVVQSAPTDEERRPYFLWHLRILPRLATPAGFELGSGMAINAVAPEAAAARLREAARPCAALRGTTGR